MLISKLQLARPILRLIGRKYIKADEKFQQQTRDLLATQLKLLFSKLQKNADTEYGRKYGFNRISTIKDFQKQLPIVEYEDIVEYIEREKQGEENILTSQKPIRFVTTSGTTGSQKYIPITLDSKKEHINSWDIWIRNLLNEHPRILLGKTISIIPPSTESYTSAGIPISSITSLIYESQSFLSRMFYALPKEMCHVKDNGTRNYLFLRLGLEKNISVLNSVNPSTIKQLCLMGSERREELIKDIYDGTISFPVTNEDSEIISKLKLKPNKKKARQLEDIAKKTDFFPKDYWNLESVSCWKGGTLFLYLNSFPEFFGNTSIRDIGLIASEGRFSIPISDKGSEGILDISSHFFEFMPQSEINSKKPITLFSHEVSVGEKYFIIPTTSSGLYRYNIHDLIEVCGFYNKTPVIKFLNKGNNFSSITGEKISEYQVVESMKKTCEKTGLNIDNFLVSPVWEEKPRYILLIEESSAPNLKQITGIFDNCLRELNIEYDFKRKSRLEGIVLGLLPQGTFKRIEQEKNKESNDIQYKHRFLNPEIDFYKKLNPTLVI